MNNAASDVDPGKPSKSIAWAKCRCRSLMRGHRMLTECLRKLRLLCEDFRAHTTWSSYGELPVIAEAAMEAHVVKQRKMNNQ